MMLALVVMCALIDKVYNHHRCLRGPMLHCCLMGVPILFLWINWGRVRLDMCKSEKF